VNTRILQDPKYDYIFSVEEVNRRVVNGLPFRDAYKLVGEIIDKGDFHPIKTVEHTHEGSIGNLCLDKILLKKNKILKEFNFRKVEKAITGLLENYGN
jgi:argininosuccinate lyase